jgi:hypothetical protein
LQGGTSTSDEMCIAFVYMSPAQATTLSVYILSNPETMMILLDAEHLTRVYFGGSDSHIGEMMTLLLMRLVRENKRLNRYRLVKSVKLLLRRFSSAPRR